MTKNSIFGAFTAVSVVGFGMFAGVSVFCQDALTLPTAIMGFYSFLSTTAIFYLLYASKTDADSAQEYSHREDDTMWRQLHMMEERLDRELTDIRIELGSNTTVSKKR